MGGDNYGRNMIRGEKVGKNEEKVAEGIQMEGIFGEKEKQEGKSEGGMLIGVKKNIKVEMEEEEEEEGKMVCKIKIGGEDWRIVGVYVNLDLERKLEGIRKWMEEEEEEVRTLIGGDFNARTREEGG